MEMFDEKSMNERIGSMKKSDTLLPLKEVEEYFLKQMKKYEFEASYDVIANELPYFNTINYTEFAHCFMIHPLNQELRIKQICDAYNDDVDIDINYVEFFKNKVLEKSANKYKDMENDKDYDPRSNLVVLVGSNKLKDRICLNKLRVISKMCKEDVWFKPHPITHFSLVGELMDLFGENKILPRNADLYSFLKCADTVFTTHMSESALYAVCLDKVIEPIDVYQKVEQGSFYHINKFLFTEKNPKEWVNKTFNSYKSGIINPTIDVNWKEKIDNYLFYINSIRKEYKNKYIEVKQSKK